jgi:hypothetical protein
VQNEPFVEFVIYITAHAKPLPSTRIDANAVVAASNILEMRDCGLVILAASGSCVH